MVGHDARDCDVGIKERPRNCRGATLDEGKTEAASICGRESHPHIRLELRAVSLAKVPERLIALYRSRCENRPRCFHFGLVDRTQNLKDVDTVQRIGGPTEKFASSLVRLKNDQVIEVEGYEWVPALAEGPSDYRRRWPACHRNHLPSSAVRESPAQYPGESALRDS